MSRILASFDPVPGETFLIGGIVYEILTRRLGDAYRVRAVERMSGGDSVQLGQTRTVFADSIAIRFIKKPEKVADNMADNIKWAYELLQGEMEDMSGDEELSYLDDVVAHGCGSGIVGPVIYSHDNRKIFTDNLVDILELLDEYADEIGADPLSDYDYTQLPDMAVWFGVELAASLMVNDLREAARDRQEQY